MSDTPNPLVQQQIDEAAKHAGVPPSSEIHGTDPTPSPVQTVQSPVEPSPESPLLHDEHILTPSSPAPMPPSPDVTVIPRQDSQSTKDTSSEEVVIKAEHSSDPPIPTSEKSQQNPVRLHHRIIPKVLTLLILMVGIATGGYYTSIVKPGSIFDYRRYAADNMCNVNPGSCSTEQDWISGWYAAREPQNADATPNQPEFTNARDDQNKDKPGQQVEIIRDVGQSGVGDPGSENRTGKGYTLEEGSVKETKDASGNTVITVNLGKAIPFGGAIDYRGTPEGSTTSYPTGDKCSGLAERQARDCLANTTSGLFSSGGCVGMSVQQCAAWATTHGYSLQYCSGKQESAGTDRAGEFLTCGGNSTGGCGQLDIIDASGNVKGFIIDKTGCGGGSSSSSGSSTSQASSGSSSNDHNGTSSEPTATPTPTHSAPQCQNIKIYKDGQLIDVTTVSPGDHIVVAVAGTNATKGRFRFNGAPLNGETSGFTESTGTNTSDEFTLPLTIPSNVTSIKIEAEVFKNGVWQ